MTLSDAKRDLVVDKEATARTLTHVTGVVTQSAQMIGDAENITEEEEMTDEIEIETVIEGEDAIVTTDTSHTDDHQEETEMKREDGGEDLRHLLQDHLRGVIASTSTREMMMRSRVSNGTIRDNQTSQSEFNNC